MPNSVACILRVNTVLRLCLLEKERNNAIFINYTKGI